MMERNILLTKEVARLSEIKSKNDSMFIAMCKELEETNSEMEVIFERLELILQDNEVPGLTIERIMKELREV
ncbi:MAG: hypothetical protein ACRC5T_06875 [Cetobacterium sp.]